MIQGVEQPDIIHINTGLRLRKFDFHYGFALDWYQDLETVRLVDGENAKAYDTGKLYRMYSYLNNIGELYFIGILEGNEFIPIGDVTFWQEDMPIVIGNKRYRNCGIGTQVIRALIERAVSIGYKTIYVREIYNFNEGSKALFLKNGFKPYKRTLSIKNHCIFN